MSQAVPYKHMLRDSRTLHDWGIMELDEGYSIRVREKVFLLTDAEGRDYRRGPCLSMQLFHENHFLKAISLPWERVSLLRDTLAELLKMKGQGR